jgi:hypothetical protein
VERSRLFFRDLSEVNARRKRNHKTQEQKSPSWPGLLTRPPPS